MNVIGSSQFFYNRLILFQGHPSPRRFPVLPPASSSREPHMLQGLLVVALFATVMPRAGRRNFAHWAAVCAPQNGFVRLPALGALRIVWCTASMPCAT